MRGVGKGIWDENLATARRIRVEKCFTFPEERKKKRDPPLSFAKTEANARTGIDLYPVKRISICKSKFRFKSGKLTRPEVKHRDVRQWFPG